MSSPPREWLILAQQIISARADEAAWRCAASRAYYAALHTVSGTFPGVQRMPGVRESSHEEIIRQAASYGRGTGSGRAAAVAHSLARMKAERTSADYHLHKDFTAENAEQMLKRAATVIESCDALLPEIQAMPVPPVTDEPPEPPAPPPATPGARSFRLVR